MTGDLNPFTASFGTAADAEMARLHRMIQAIGDKIDDILRGHHDGWDRAMSALRDEIRGYGCPRRQDKCNFKISGLKGQSPSGDPEGSVAAIYHCQDCDRAWFVAVVDGNVAEVRPWVEQ